MQSALVNLSTNIVDNIIIADPSIDATPDGYVMIPSPPDFVTLGIAWDGQNFIRPAPIEIPGVTVPAPVAGLETI